MTLTHGQLLVDAWRLRAFLISRNYPEREASLAVGAILKRAMRAGREVSAYCGIEQAILNAYLASWLRCPEKDRGLVVVAAGQAQRAADWILGLKREDEGEGEE